MIRKYGVKLAEDEFIHEYALDDKHCVVSDEKSAHGFSSYGDAGWIADRFGGEVVILKGRGVVRDAKT